MTIQERMTPIYQACGYDAGYASRIVAELATTGEARLYASGGTTVSIRGSNTSAGFVAEVESRDTNGRVTYEDSKPFGTMQSAIVASMKVIRSIR